MQPVQLEATGSAPTARPWWARLDVALLALVALPLLLLLFDRNYFVTLYGLDPWFYSGYFLNYPSFVQTFAGTYYGTRLSVILPGWLAYRVLPDTLANYALHVGVYLTALLCLYALLADLVNRRAAFLATALMGCFPWFVVAMSWDYVDGYGLAYCLLAYALINASMRSSYRRLCLLGGGAAVAALAVANTFYGVLVPFLVGFHVAAARERERSVVWDIGWIALGGVLVVSGLGAFNHWMGGRFLFFLPSIEFGYNLAQQANPWAKPLSVWLPRASWIYLPFTVGAASLFQLVMWLSRPASRPGPLRFYLHVQLVAQLLLFTALEATGRAPVLQICFYVDMLLPAAFLALGDHLREPAVSIKRFWPVAGLAFCLFFVSLVCSRSIASAVGPSAGVLFPLAGCVALGMSRVRRLPSLVSFAVVALLAAGNCAARHPDHLSQSLPGSEARRQLRSSILHERLAVLRTVVRTVRLIRRYEGEGNVWFWFDRQSPQVKVYDAVASTHLWGFRLVSLKFPDSVAEPLATRMLEPGVKVAVLDQQDDTLDRACSALARQGVATDQFYQGWIGEGPAAYRLTLLETHASSQQIGRARPPGP